MQSNTRTNESLEIYTDAQKIIKQALPILLLTLIGSLLAGIVLGGMEKTLETIPGLIVVVPAMLDMRGNIYGALGAKLSTGLHQGLIKPRFSKNQNLGNAIIASTINSVAISAVLSIFAWLVLNFLGREIISIIQLTIITILAGIISGLILTVIVIYAIFFSYRKGLDPDNVIGPTVTVSGDIFTILILFLVAEQVMGAL